MNCRKADPQFANSKNGLHRKEMKAVLRSISNTLGAYPGYWTVMEALHARGYKCGQSLARELLRTWWLPE